MAPSNAALTTLRGASGALPYPVDGMRDRRPARGQGMPGAVP